MFSYRKQILVGLWLISLSTTVESLAVAREKKSTSKASNSPRATEATRGQSPAAESESVAFQGVASCSVQADSTIPEVRPAIPQIHRINDRNHGGHHDNWWFRFTDTYSGSPPKEASQGAFVISNIELQGVYLGSSFASTNSGDVTTREAYLNFLATSTYLTELQPPYGASSGTSVAGKVINAALPQYTSSQTFLQDTDIVTYLATNINNGTLTPSTASTVYVVFVEPGVAVDAGSGSTSINAFLGYHNTAQFTATGGSTETIYYAVLPYPGSPNPSPASQGFSTVTDELTAVTSHEVAESVTDPDTVSGWTETVTETVSFTFFRWITFQYAFLLTGEEIADVTLLLNNDGPECYARYSNGYLVQRVIGPDGVTPLTPSGAITLASTSPYSSSDRDSDSDDNGLTVMGFFRLQLR